MNERQVELVMPAGHTLSVTSFGAGQPLMLLHGFPLDATIWRPCCAQLVTAGYQVLTPDLRGFGKSSKIHPPVSIGDIADDIEQVRRVLLGSSRIILGGLSLGGYVAFEYWKRHPDHLQALILSNTKPQADSAEARQGRLAMAEKAVKESTWSAVSPMLGKLLSPDTLQHAPATTQQVTSMMSAVPASTVSAIQHAMAERHDFSSELQSIRVPTLVVTGENDPISPPAENQQWATKIPQHQIVVIPGAAHLPQVEATEELCQAILGFLASHTR